MKLIEFVGRASIERAQSNVWLEVLKTNTRAQRLYANCGFQRSGEIPFSTDITDIGMVIMVRELVSKYSFE